MIPFQYLAFEEIQYNGDPALVTTARVLNLTDDIAYSLASYAPVVAPLRPRTIAGGGDYADVEDTITVHVLGSTSSRCTANYEALLEVIDQGGRWWSGESVNVIRLAAEVQGTAVGKLSALVLGSPEGTPPGQVAPEWDVSANCWVMRDVELRIIRRGRWLGEVGSGGYGVVTTAANPAVGRIDIPNPLVTAILSYSPIAYWPLDDLSGNIARDASGNGRVGSYNLVGVVQGQFVEPFVCPTFNGSTGYVDVYSASLSAAFTPDAGSMIAFARLNDSNLSAAIVGLSTSTSRTINLQAIGDGAGGYNAQGIRTVSTNFKQAFDLATTPINEWTMLALTWTTSGGGALRLYVNGALAATVTNLNPWGTSPLALNACVIGDIVLAPTNRFSGEIAHVAVIPSVLDAAAVADIYAASGL